MTAALATDPRTMQTTAALERVVEVFVAAVNVELSGAELLFASKELALSSAEVASMRIKLCRHMMGGYDQIVFVADVPDGNETEKGVDRGYHLHLALHAAKLNANPT